MSSSALRRVLVLLCVVLLSFTSCGTYSSGTVKVKSNNTAANAVTVENIDEAYNVILSNCTKEFIGGYPVDESFMSWVCSVAGSDAITSIAEGGVYDDPDVWYEATGQSIYVLWYNYCKNYGMSVDEDVYQISTSSDDSVVLDFAGDYSVADNIATTNYMLSQSNGILDCFSDDLLEEMQGADLMVLNNEFCYTNRGEAIEGKAYTFRGDPSTVYYLQDIGVDLVSVANNHVYDFGEIGLTDTLDALHIASIPYIGAGRNLSEAMRPAYYIANGRMIAVCAATQVERAYTYTKEATDNTPGVLKTLKSEKFCSEIAEAKANADTVIVICHWGTEGNSSYGADQAKLAKEFVEAGADAIIGGHTHCLQAVEYVEDVPVFYSLGNYWFSTTDNMPSNYDTGLAQVRIANDNTITCSFLPCEFTSGVTSLSSGSEKSEIIDHLQSLSNTVEIDNEGNITKK